jgi:metal-dependent phosphohydrolase, HD superfamily, putative
MPYKQDEEFMAYVGHLIEKPSVHRLKEIPHHIHSKDLNIPSM